MNLCSFKVFLCLLVGYNLFTVVTPFEPLPGKALHPALRQHAEFGEGVRDWFKGVRDKVRNFFNQPTTTTTTPPPLVEVESIKQAMYKFFVDLANTRFNPDRDWGFRMGSWYFIKKVDDSSDNDKTTENIPTTTESDSFTREREEFITSTSAHPVTYTEEIETLEHGQAEFITSTSIHPVAITEDIETLGQGHKEYTTSYVSTIPEVTTEANSKSNKESGEEVDVTTAATTKVGEEPGKQDKENEIPARGPQSAEVISPK